MDQGDGVMHKGNLVQGSSEATGSRELDENNGQLSPLPSLVNTSVDLPKRDKGHMRICMSAHTVVFRVRKSFMLAAIIIADPAQPQGNLCFVILPHCFAQLTALTSSMGQALAVPMAGAGDGSIKGTSRGGRPLVSIYRC